MEFIEKELSKEELMYLEQAAQKMVNVIKFRAKEPEKINDDELKKKFVDNMIKIIQGELRPKKQKESVTDKLLELVG